MASLIVESPYAEEWLYGVLANDPQILSSVVQGRVYRNFVGQDPNDSPGTLLPAIRFVEISGSDLYVVGAYRVWNALYYQVEVIDRADSVLHLRSVANRVDSLLHGVSGLVSGARIVSCTRNSTINRTSISEVIQYQHIGGLYRLNVQSWDGVIAKIPLYISGV